MASTRWTFCSHCPNHLPTPWYAMQGMSTSGRVEAGCRGHVCRTWMGCSTEVDLTAPTIACLWCGCWNWMLTPSGSRTTAAGGRQPALAAHKPDSSDIPRRQCGGWIVELNPSSSGQIMGDEVPTGKEWMLRKPCSTTKKLGLFWAFATRLLRGHACRHVGSSARDKFTDSS